MSKKNVVSIFTAPKAKCRCCKDVFRIPGFPLNAEGVCGICVIGKENQRLRLKELT